MKIQTLGWSLIIAGLLLVFTGGFLIGQRIESEITSKNVAPELPQVSWAEWTQWSEAKITSDMWEGTKIWQFRTNFDTGECQGRCQLLSPTGGYK